MTAVLRVGRRGASGGRLEIRAHWEDPGPTDVEDHRGDTGNCRLPGPTTRIARDASEFTSEAASEC